MTLEPSTVRLLTQRLAVEQSSRRLPSIVAAVVRDGRVVWSGAAGTLDGRADGTPASVDVQYRIGSITKTFVAAAVMRLRDEGLLSLADTIGTHLPEVPFGHVTIAQLLTHTSGLQAETNGEWWERTPGGDWDDLMASAPSLRAAPGVAFHYSNVGFAVLGELVARLRARPWDAVVHDELLVPLGMTRTTTRPQAPAAPGLAVHPLADLLHVEPEHDAGAMAPAGQLWSTVADLGRWAAFLAGGASEAVLSHATVQEMARPVAVNDVPGQPWTGAHGLGVQTWNVGGRQFVGHGGSMPGFLAGLRVDAQTGDAAVLLTNATSGLGTALPDLMAILREHEPVSPRPWHADAAQADGLELVGDWFWGTSTYRLTLAADGDVRLGTPGEARGSRFRRAADGWVGLDGYYRGEPLAVRRDTTGTITHLELASFVFTRTPYDAAADVPGGVDELRWH